MNYISFEGPDGFGKSTTLSDCKPYLKKLNPSYVKEPGGTKQGKRLQKMIISPKSNHMDPMTMAYLMATARCDLMAAKVSPDIEKGKFVVSDRCLLSSYAYQGMGILKQHPKLNSEIACGVVSAINEAATIDFKYIPSIVFLFTTAKLSTIKSRLNGRKGKSDRIDKKLAKGTQALTNLQTAYQNAAKYWNLHFGNRSKVVLIDASWSRKKRRDTVIKNIKKLLK